jgi:hypothetical protein
MNRASFLDMGGFSFRLRLCYNVLLNLFLWRMATGIHRDSPFAGVTGHAEHRLRVRVAGAGCVLGLSGSDHSGQPIKTPRIGS